MPNFEQDFDNSTLSEHIASVEEMLVAQQKLRDLLNKLRAARNSLIEISTPETLLHFNQVVKEIEAIGFDFNKSSFYAEYKKTIYLVIHYWIKQYRTNLNTIHFYIGNNIDYDTLGFQWPMNFLKIYSCKRVKFPKALSCAIIIDIDNVKETIAPGLIEVDVILTSDSKGGCDILDLPELKRCSSIDSYSLKILNAPKLVSIKQGIELNVATEVILGGGHIKAPYGILIPKVKKLTFTSEFTKIDGNLSCSNFLYKNTIKPLINQGKLIISGQIIIDETVL